jgi:hypothetical protein
MTQPLSEIPFVRILISTSQVATLTNAHIAR